MYHAFKKSLWTERWLCQQCCLLPLRRFVRREALIGIKGKVFITITISTVITISILYRHHHHPPNYVSRFNLIGVCDASSEMHRLHDVLQFFGTSLKIASLKIEIHRSKHCIVKQKMRYFLWCLRFQNGPNTVLGILVINKQTWFFNKKKNIWAGLNNWISSVYPIWRQIYFISKLFLRKSKILGQFLTSSVSTYCLFVVCRLHGDISIYLHRMMF